MTTAFASFDIICCALICIFIFRFIYSRWLAKGLRFPPGPSAMFIVENMAELRKGPLWETADRWAKEYGELVHVNILGQHIIFLNSLSIARDLLEKKSSIYSDRVQIPMLKLMGWDGMTVMLSYGDVWRRHRKMLHQYLSLEGVAPYQNIQIKQTRDFIQRLHESPDNFLYHIRHLAGSVLMEIVYGIRILPKEDPYIRAVESALAVSADAAVPGKFLVNILPFLKYVPEWMPGAGFHRIAREWQVTVRNMVNMPFEAARDSLFKKKEAGTAEPSMAGTLLENLSQRTDVPTDEVNIIRDLCSGSFSAGADSTVSALSTFVLAMLLHPNVQRKAQCELDSVIGDRLPTFEDRERLPYVSAVCKEVLRWRPPFPLGVPHRLMEDDVYNEYMIPAGSLILGNAWTMLRDEKLYGPNPGMFDPERFLRPGAIEPIGQFGFGRRICAGRFLANSSLFIAAASFLKVFDILPAKDENGNEIPTKVTYTTALLAHPEPFQCTITPRSQSVVQTLLADPLDS